MISDKHEAFLAETKADTKALIHKTEVRQRHPSRESRLRSKHPRPKARLKPRHFSEQLGVAVPH